MTAIIKFATRSLTPKSERNKEVKLQTVWLRVNYHRWASAKNKKEIVARNLVLKG